MTTAQFFEKFDLFAGAPDAVDKMRELTLHLAVMGKLTEGDPKREAVASKYTNEPVADFLPSNWRLLSFGKFCDIQGGNQPPKSEFSDKPKPGYVRLFQIRDLGEKPSPVYISEQSTNRFCRGGEILIGRYGASVGKIFWAQDGAYNVALAKFIFPEDALIPAFAFWVLKSDFFQAKVAGASRSAQAGFNKGDLAAIDFPLPPIAEQKRIVAKVDELMALCDQLEAQQQERETKHTALAQATLARFAETPTPTNLNLLFHSSFSIQPSDLRKTILTLAVQGKLVPQDPNDEPAEEILARIAATKLRLQRTGEIGKEKLVEPLQPDSLPFKAPDSWRWAKLAELTELITKGSSPKWQGIAYVSESEGILFITSENVGNYVLKKLDDLKYVSKGFNEIEPRSILKRGDILMNLVGASIGRTAVYDLHDGANINQAVALIRLVRETDGVCPRFLLHYLNSPSAIDYMLASRVVNAQPNISLTDAREFTVPIPPLAEQKRIAAKVEELMALVDALEAQQAAADKAATHLLDAVVSELAAAA